MHTPGTPRHLLMLFLLDHHPAGTFLFRSTLMLHPTHPTPTHVPTTSNTHTDALHHSLTHPHHPLHTQMILLDTPGVIQDQRNRLEQRMMRAVKSAIRDADALLAIIDASDRPEEALAMVQVRAGVWGVEDTCCVL